MMTADAVLPTHKEDAIDCTRVSYQLGKRTILNSVSFSVKRGEVAGLLGPNGAGKSTLFRIVSGIVPPTSGQVRLVGEQAGVSTLTKTALLPDRGKLPGWLTAREWLSFASRIYPDWDADRADDLALRLGIAMETRITSMSRGEEARLQLLTCLARQAPVVLLDEPFAGVDLVSRERIATSVVRELAGGDRAFLIATHDIREMEQLFDKIVLLGDGSVRGEVSVEQLRERGSSVEMRYREEFE